ncbi:hypothetical protein ACSTDZ_22275 [Vibrio vulnificus]|uniref:Uncharacterized protein n=1 Tax=Vibrio vulnificus TaxID=672 RepID=A0A6S4QB02_VIBVL|nr:MULTISPECIES: hypothetical protein [Vibrio]ASJ38385.1 hypothetical protein VVCECT4999_06660 [Vibrio vulnificus]MBE3658930.1 hypothetical protein [Vibrio navarrensis]PNG69965.1 hypothetical protein TI24_12635 [Vibrio vulnificus]PNG75922.1 hypothetical protein TI31_13835 [Vibrio vulnificus]BBE38645.1 conserved hypothetical protein [Vibrio vulnificus]
MDLLTSLIGFVGVVVGSVISYVATYKLKKLELQTNERQKKKDQLNLVYCSFLSKVSTAISALDIDNSKDYSKYLPPIDEELILIELLSSNEVYMKASLLVAELTDLFADEPSVTFGSINKLKTDFVNAVQTQHKSNV